jgi:hypothetical protein
VSESCEALLITGGRTRADRIQRGETCLAHAAFESRGKACCWVHYQADTRGPRAGKVEWAKGGKRA